MTNKELLKEIEGEEVWWNSDRFEERVCVGIRNGKIVNGGIEYKPTQKEIRELWDAVVANI